MTAAEGSFLGLAKQTAYGTPNTTDSSFKYLLFQQGSIAPNNVVIPLDAEVGGGALMRSMVKVAVSSGGAIQVVPRPETLGHFLYGVTGAVTSELNGYPSGILGPVRLLVGAQAGYTNGIHQPDSAKALYVQVFPTGYVPPVPSPSLSPSLSGSKSASRSTSPSRSLSPSASSSVSIPGDVVIHGMVGGVATTETIQAFGAVRSYGTKLFTSVTSVDLPAYGSAGDTLSIGYNGLYYKHTFKLGTDNFSAPYYTIRSSPGAMWGEQFQDCRVNLASIDWRAAGFVGGAFGLMGGLPTQVATTTWGAIARVDGGPQFLAPYGDIELPEGTDISVLNGSFVATAAIPLDEQYVVGSFVPQGLDIVSKAFAVQMTIKISDDTLYKKVAYDPAGGSAWAAAIMREGNFRLSFRSDVGQYFLQIQGNGSSDSNANVMWSAAPIGLRAQRQVLMSVTGMFLAPANDTHAIKITLVNQKASY